MRIKFELGDGRGRTAHRHYVDIRDDNGIKQPVICCAEFSKQLYAEHFMHCSQKRCKGHPLVEHDEILLDPNIINQRDTE